MKLTGKLEGAEPPRNLQGVREAQPPAWGVGGWGGDVLMSWRRWDGSQGFKRSKKVENN